MSFWSSVGNALGTAAGSAAAIGVINLFSGDKKKASVSGQSALPQQQQQRYQSASFDSTQRSIASNRELGLSQSRTKTTALQDPALVNLAAFTNDNTRLDKVREAVIAQLINNNASESEIRNVQTVWGISDQELLKARTEIATPKQGFATSIKV